MHVNSSLACYGSSGPESEVEEPAETNPLDVVYEAVAKASCRNVTTEPCGWVDVQLVIDAVREGLSRDMDLSSAIALEALDNWCILELMRFNSQRTKIKFVVPYFYPDDCVQPVLPDECQRCDEDVATQVRGGWNEIGGRDDLPGEVYYVIKQSQAAISLAPGVGVPFWPPAAGQVNDEHGSIGVPGSEGHGPGEDAIEAPEMGMPSAASPLLRVPCFKFIETPSRDRLLAVRKCVSFSLESFLGPQFAKGEKSDFDIRKITMV